jgi:hypothetical protein
MITRSLALLGGPGSGKTTYLGALVDALESERLPGISMSGAAIDTQPQQLLVDPLLNGRYFQQPSTDERLALPLRYALPDGDPQPFVLSVGDYDGEAIERLFNNRIDGWSDEWRVRAEASAFLLMLRPGAFEPLPLLGRAPRGEPPPARERERFGSSPSSVFGPGIVDAEIPARRVVRPDESIRIPIPTVVGLVELLQFIRHARNLAPGERPPLGELRVAVVLSAWDALDERWQARRPAEYARAHASLLVDFLASNFRADDMMMFGLSATGGDLRDEAHREHYLEHPGGYVTWADATGQVQTTSDLALPIRWALFGDAAMRHDP